jgi:hypothetical protein
MVEADEGLYYGRVISDEAIQACVSDDVPDGHIGLLADGEWVNVEVQKAQTQRDDTSYYEDAKGRMWCPLDGRMMSDEEKAKCDAWDGGWSSEVTAGQIQAALANVDRSQLESLGEVTTRTDEEGVLWVETWDFGTGPSKSAVVKLPQPGWGYIGMVRVKGVWGAAHGGSTFATDQGRLGPPRR